MTPLVTKNLLFMGKFFKKNFFDQTLLHMREQLALKWPMFKVDLKNQIDRFGNAIFSGLIFFNLFKYVTNRSGFDLDVTKLQIYMTGHVNHDPKSLWSRFFYFSKKIKITKIISNNKKSNFISKRLKNWVYNHIKSFIRQRK